MPQLGRSIMTNDSKEQKKVKDHLNLVLKASTYTMIL